MAAAWPTADERMAIEPHASAGDRARLVYRAWQHFRGLSPERQFAFLAQAKEQSVHPDTEGGREFIEGTARALAWRAHQRTIAPGPTTAEPPKQTQADEGTTAE